MVWIVLAARTLACCLSCLVLIHQVEIHVMNHCLLFAHVTGAWSLDGPEATATNFMMNNGVVHAASMRNSIHLLLSSTSCSLA